MVEDQRLAYERDEESDQDEEVEQDEELLEEVRDRYRYYDDAWRDAREDSRKDRRYLAGDPWEIEDRKIREDADRPCISHDELTQYVNQGVNNLRQNKRGIKVEAAGGRSNEKTAELRQNLIRTIEYRSQAQSSYITAYENALEGSYGFFRISRRYIGETFHQEIVVKNIANPDSVLYDPDCKEADWSDAQACFVLEPISIKEFKRRYPGAQIKDFSPEHMRLAKDWFQAQLIIVAEYWRVEVEPVTLYLLPSGKTTDKLPKGVKPLKTRELERRKVVQYITNGVEILKRIPQPGPYIPIIPVIGKELYVEEGGVSKRKLFSLVRLARDPQMSLAYLVSQQMEEAGMSPKVPYVGYTGQFESDADSWRNLTRQPRSFVQVDPIVDTAGGAILPLPRREQFVPNFEAFEVAKDSCRRAVQAAMGISPLPTAAQRSNQKSGVAIEKMQAQESLGSFHFIDNFVRSLAFAGRVMEEWIPVVYDTEREIGIRLADEKHKVIRINTAQPYTNKKTQEQEHYPVEDGDHDVTVGAGPSYASQRDEAADFLNTLISNLPTLPVPPASAAKLLSLAIQMRELGPKGDEMAEIIAPDANQPVSPQAMAQMQALQGQLQQHQALNQQLQAELQKLQGEKQARIVDNEFRLTIEKMKIDAQLAMAEINTKSQALGERIKFVEDVWRQLHAQGHEADMAAAGQEHEDQVTAAGQAHEAGMAAAGQSHEQQMAERAQQAAQEQAAQQGPPGEQQAA